MVTSLSELKKSKKSRLENLSKKADELDGQSYDDDRFWKPTIDKSGNSKATIRFLPNPPEEENEFVRLFHHGFKNFKNGQWLIENCPTTIEEQCPVCDHNTELWETGDEDKQNIARKRKRKLQYISNILVINDPFNKENNGKVFLYSYGKQVMDKIKGLMQPKFADEEKINPFDFWDGCDFNLKIFTKQVSDTERYPQYTDSSFSDPSPIAKTDKEIEEIWRQEYSLAELISEDKFKSYDEINARLQKVLHGKKAEKTAEDMMEADEEREDEEPESSSSLKDRMKKSSKSKPVTEVDEDEIPFDVDDETSEEKTEEDDDLEYFRKMAEED